MKLKRLLWTLAALLFCVQVSKAGDLNVTWTVPTACSDGSAISGCPITGWALWSIPNPGTCPPSPYSGAATQTLTTPAILTYDFAGTPTGSAWCVTVAAMSNATVGLQSNPAAGVASGPILAPGAPAASIVVPAGTALKTTGTAVFLVTNTPNGFGFTQLGTVPVGSPCIPGTGANQYNPVDQTKAAVTWTTAVHSINVVALCAAQ